MQKLTSLFLMLIPFLGGFAQTEITNETIDNGALNPASKLNQLNTTEINTNILIDRSYLFTNHTQFYKDSLGTNNYSGWEQMYLEIYNAFINTPIFPNLDSIKSRVTQQQKQGITPVLIMDISYNKIKETALADSLIINDNGIFKDVFPRATTPYETHRVISFSPGTNIIFKNQFTFLVSKQFFFSNQTVEPQSIAIDFGDGNGFKQVQWETTYTINYADIGDKTMMIKMFNVNSVSTTSSSLQQSSVCSNCFAFSLQNPPDEFGSIGGVIPAFGATAVIDYYIKSLAPKNSVNFLDKPLIIVEGLDFEDPDCNFVPFKNGGIGWCTLLGQGGAPEFGLAPNLLNDLLAKGYDIIMIDYQDGATYIERNAFALVAFLNYLNNVRHAGPSVIIGTSMGGQVSRYALAYMEKNNIKHCNRLYVSADSPHQGANIPIGFQEMVNFNANNGLNAVNNAMMDVLKKINAPAAKQMLIQHYTDFFASVSPTPNDAPQLFQNYYSSINALGFPKKTRKIALSNGIRTGTPLSMQPGELVFKWTVPGQVTSCALGNQTNFARVFANGGTPPVVFSGKVINGAAVNLCALLNLFGLPGFLICPTCFSKNTNTTIKFKTGLPYDRMPGGRRETYQATADQIAGTPIFGFQGSVLHKDHCFIPTKSALDLNGKDFFDNLTSIVDQNDPNKSLNFSPFEKLWAGDGSSSIPGSSQNELHVELTPGNINWLIKEICAGENNVGSVLTTTYNFARPENHFLNNLIIDNGGNLLVNANQLSDFGASGPQACVAPKMPLVGPTYVLESSDCMDNLEIKNGGQMRIGDNSVGNKAKVIIHSGVTVTLRAGSKLIIHNNSRLIIEKGAKLIYEAGAEIQLLGDEAVLEMQGELEIGNNATFTFIYPNSNSGYLKWNVPFNPCSSNPNWACSVITGGVNAKIDLRGADKTDKILEINGDMIIPDNIAFFRLWFGKAEFTTPGARLSLGGTRYQLNDATFVGTVTNRGIVVWGNSSSIIARCEFDRVGIRGELYAEQATD